MAKILQAISGDCSSIYFPQVKKQLDTRPPLCGRIRQVGRFCYQVMKMNEVLREKVAETLSDVFGVMFSISVKPLRDFPPGRNNRDKESCYFEARVDILNEDRFPAYFFFPEGLAKNLAENLVDFDNVTPDDEAVSVVVKDAVYMTLGSLLGKIDPEAKYGLGSPVARKIGAFSPGCLPQEDGIMGCETEFGFLWMDLGGIEQCC